MRVFADNTERFIAFWEAANYERIALGLHELRYGEARLAYDRFVWTEMLAPMSRLEMTGASA